MVGKNMPYRRTSRTEVIREEAMAEHRTLARRADALRNRERISAVAYPAFADDPRVSLNAIAKLAVSEQARCIAISQGRSLRDPVPRTGSRRVRTDRSDRWPWSSCGSASGGQPDPVAPAGDT